MEPLRIFTPETTIDGWIDAAATHRLSDLLDLEDLLSIARVRDPSDSDWFVVERERMLLVVPPPHTSERAMRPHRVKRRVVAETGHYVVRGLVHMIAGIDLDSYLARSVKHFMPLTDTWVTSTKRQELDERHIALLVNVRSSGQRLRLTLL